MARTRSMMAATLIAALACVACAGALAFRWVDVGPDAVEAVWELSFLSYAILGAMLLRHRPGNRVAWLMVAAGALVEAAALVDGYAVWAAGSGWPGEVWARWVQSILWVPALSIVLVQLPLRFPSGRVAGPRWRLVSISAWTVVGVVTIGTALAPGPIGQNLPLDNPMGIAAAGPMFSAFADAGGLLAPLAIASFASLVSRRETSLREHLQIRWFGFSLVLAGVVAALAATVSTDTGPMHVVAPIAVAVAVALPAIGIAIAVLRHRLYGIEAIISRSAVFAVMTVGAGVVALGLVAAISAVVGEFAIRGTVVTAVVVALGVHASWQFVQRRIDRAVFGERGDPYRLVRVLGSRLELAGSAEDALTTAASTLVEGLRLPFVAIEVSGPAASTVQVGRPSSTTMAFPIMAQGVAVGSLLVGLRRGEDAMGGRDKQLIGELARSLAPLCQAASLTAELRRSLERVARVRDDERQRIHRDLHDGLGPTLAGLALRLDIVRSRSAGDTVDELAALERGLKAAFTEVTTLVDGLRPRLLDDAGLVAGLLAHCEAVAETTWPGLEVTLETGGDLGDLPAAVESAAWYITVEALTNVVRHARARHCNVRLTNTEAEVEIEVTDDGVGLSSTRSDCRTGIRSMRDRAASLRGDCAIVSNQLGGTTVRANLPVEAP